MTTLTDLRDLLRIELHDEGADRWPDGVLDRHLQRAARELAFVWPRERKATLQTTAGDRDLDIASLAERVRVLAVEYPVAQYPPAYAGFAVFGDTLTLAADAPPGDAEDVNVLWGSLHTVDDVGSTLPAVAEDAVVTGAAGYAAVEWASFATNRANIGGAGVPVDYLRWGEHKLAQFHQALRRFGDNGRVRASRLRVPAAPDPSRRLVTWEC